MAQGCLALKAISRRSYDCRQTSAPSGGGIGEDMARSSNGMLQLTLRFPKLPYCRLIETLSDLRRVAHPDARALERQTDGLLAKRLKNHGLGRSF